MSHECCDSNPAVNLDDLAAMRDLDKNEMLALVLEFPDQVERATEIAREFEPRKVFHPRNLVVTGLGGSAIGGELLAGLLQPACPVPVIVNRGYDLPAFTDSNTLVIAASYSGNTEETLSAYGQAVSKGAVVVCITSGGELASRAATDGSQVIKIPGGQPPRSATGYMLVPMLYIASSYGLTTDKSDDLREAVGLLGRLRDRLAPAVKTDSNPAKRLAIALCRRIPVLYGSEGFKGSLAVRWKDQFNENAKVHAFANVFPELNHNEILAWDESRLQSDSFSVVIIRDPADPPRIAVRLEITKKLIEGKADIHEVWCEGESDLARMLTGFYIGDFVSVYLAFLNGVDPTAIGAINLLKKELEKVPV